MQETEEVDVDVHEVDDALELVVPDLQLNSSACSNVDLGPHQGTRLQRDGVAYPDTT